MLRCSCCQTELAQWSGDIFFALLALSVEVIKVFREISLVENVWIFFFVTQVGGKSSLLPRTDPMTPKIILLVVAGIAFVASYSPACRFIGAKGMFCSVCSYCTSRFSSYSRCAVIAVVHCSLLFLLIVGLISTR